MFNAASAKPTSRRSVSLGRASCIVKTTSSGKRPRRALLPTTGWPELYPGSLGIKGPRDPPQRGGGGTDRPLPSSSPVLCLWDAEVETRKEDVAWPPHLGSARQQQRSARWQRPEAQQLALGPFPTPESPGQKLRDSSFQIPKVCQEFGAAESFLLQIEILNPEGNLGTNRNFPLPKDPSQEGIFWRWVREPSPCHYP